MRVWWAWSGSREGQVLFATSQVILDKARLSFASKAKWGACQRFPSPVALHQHQDGPSLETDTWSACSFWPVRRKGCFIPWPADFPLLPLIIIPNRGSFPGIPRPWNQIRKLEYGCLYKGTRGKFCDFRLLIQWILNTYSLPCTELSKGNKIVFWVDIVLDFHYTQEDSYSRNKQVDHDSAGGKRYEGS